MDGLRGLPKWQKQGGFFLCPLKDQRAKVFAQTMAPRSAQMAKIDQRRGSSLGRNPIAEQSSRTFGDFQPFGHSQPRRHRVCAGHRTELIYINCSDGNRVRIVFDLTEPDYPEVLP